MKLLTAPHAGADAALAPRGWGTQTQHNMLGQGALRTAQCPWALGVPHPHADQGRVQGA